MFMGAKSNEAGRPRARSLGLRFDGDPGAHNSIGDVAGVEVGYRTLIEDDCVRTGVTVVLPRGRQDALRPVRAGLHSFNGNGELTGSHWIHEVGSFTGPIGITNTNGIGAVHEGLQRWLISNSQGDDLRWFLPVAAETWDGYLNDIEGFHVRPGHVADAIEAAHGGSIEEGNVGGGTGMRCYGFKGGSGTSSRLVPATGWTVGAFVQANFGKRHELRLRDVPLGAMLGDDLPAETPGSGFGSIIAILATDAPLSSVQLAALARRAAIGMARTGTCGHHESGDIFLAFSTSENSGLAVKDADLSAYFGAAADAVEEAILNAMVAALPMTGFRNRSLSALDHEQVRKLAADYASFAGGRQN
jgi:L-aminopeptidase/D-esterase-like protein